MFQNSFCYGELFLFFQFRGFTFGSLIELLLCLGHLESPLFLECCFLFGQRVCSFLFGVC